MCGFFSKGGPKKQGEGTRGVKGWPRKVRKNSVAMLFVKVFCGRLSF